MHSSTPPASTERRGLRTVALELDAIISDSLNHASIIDGVRLCKAMRYRYANNDMADLEQQAFKTAKKGMERATSSSSPMVCSVWTVSLPITKGVCDLADKYEAMVMVDECHAAGFIGKTGRGVEHCGVTGRVDIITGTLGKALGGAMGVHQRAQGDRGTASSAQPSVPLQQFAGAFHRGRFHQGDRLLSSTTALRDKLRQTWIGSARASEKLGFKTRGAGAAIVSCDAR